MRALVLDAHASAGVAVVQALGPAGVEVHVAGNEAGIVAYSRHVSRRLGDAPKADSAAYLEWIRAQDQSNAYTLIVATTEASLRALQASPAGDPLRVKAVLPAPDSVEIALDKAATWRLARELGLPVPDALVIPRGTAPAYGGPYPVVLKSVASQVLRDGELQYAAACIARHPVMRDAFIGSWGPHTDIQQQAWVPGRGWGIECLYRNGALCWWFAHERLHEMPLTGGASTYRRASAPPAGMLEAARSMLDRLHWHGIAMVEFRADEDGRFVLLEINPRLWGSLPLAIAAGLNFPLGLLRVARGEAPGPRPQPRLGLRMRHLQHDLEWLRENCSADRADPLLLTRPRVRSLLEWARVLGGSERWDHFVLSDPAPGAAQIVGVARRALRSMFSGLQRRLLRLEMRHRHASNRARIAASARDPQSIMFVCYGNICRSPLAEFLARRQHPGGSFCSSGLHATPGSQSPAHMLRVARGLGVDLEPHRAKPTTEDLIDSSDLVLVMDDRNYEQILARFPSVRGKLLLLGMFGDAPSPVIADPIDFDDAAAAANAAGIASAVSGLMNWLQARRPADY